MHNVRRNAASPPQGSGWPSKGAFQRQKKHRNTTHKRVRIDKSRINKESSDHLCPGYTIYIPGNHLGLIFFFFFLLLHFFSSNCSNISIAATVLQSLGLSRKKSSLLSWQTGNMSFEKQACALGKNMVFSLGWYTSSMGCCNPIGGILDVPVIKRRRMPREALQCTPLLFSVQKWRF